MNPEINRKFREIQRKCDNKKPEHYPSYCHRATLETLDLIHLLLDELTKIEAAITLSPYVKNEEAQPR